MPTGSHVADPTPLTRLVSIDTCGGRAFSNPNTPNKPVDDLYARIVKNLVYGLKVINLRESGTKTWGRPFPATPGWLCRAAHGERGAGLSLTGFLTRTKFPDDYPANAGFLPSLVTYFFVCLCCAQTHLCTTLIVEQSPSSPHSRAKNRPFCRCGTKTT